MILTLLGNEMLLAVGMHCTHGYTKLELYIDIRIRHILIIQQFITRIIGSYIN